MFSLMACGSALAMWEAKCSEARECSHDINSSSLREESQCQTANDSARLDEYFSNSPITIYRIPVVYVRRAEMSFARTSRA